MILYCPPAEQTPKRFSSSISDGELGLLTWLFVGCSELPAEPLQLTEDEESVSSSLAFLGGGEQADASAPELDIWNADQTIRI